MNRTLLLACCLAFRLSAQAPLTYDAYLGAVNAQGDFRSELGSITGIDLAVSLTVPLTARIAIRPRISHELFPVLENNYTYQSTRYSDRGFENAKWSAWSYGSDLLFYPTGREGRLYLLTGLYYKAWRVESYGTYTTQDRLNGTRTFSVDDTSTSNEPAVAAGIGLRLFRHVSVESRMTLASYRKLSYNTLHGGVVISF
jgi:hypothetical protein